MQVKWKGCIGSGLCSTLSGVRVSASQGPGLTCVQFSSVAQLCLTLCKLMDCSTRSLPVHHQLPAFTQTHVHWVSDAIQPPHLLSSPSPPSIRVFSNESVLRIRWPKFWSFSFTISPCNEYSGLVSFRMDWLDLLPVQGTLKSLLQHHSSSLLWGRVNFEPLWVSAKRTTPVDVVHLMPRKNELWCLWLRRVSFLPAVSLSFLFLAVATQGSHLDCLWGSHKSPQGRSS